MNSIRVGFLHLASSDQRTQLEILKCKLKDAAPNNEVQGSLLVLPEAFNLKFYSSNGEKPDPSILKQLQAVSAEHRLSIVAALVDETVNGNPKGYATAYLIDGKGNATPISRKQNSDGYDIYVTSQDKFGSIQHRGLNLRALICMDAKPRYAPCVLFDPLIHGTQLLCVPARCDEVTQAEIRKSPANIVLANGPQPDKGETPRSFIKLSNGVECESASDASDLQFAELPLAE